MRFTASGKGRSLPYFAHSRLGPARMLGTGAIVHTGTGHAGRQTREGGGGSEVHRPPVRPASGPGTFGKVRS